MARKTKAQRKERRKKILSKVKKGGRLVMRVSMIATRGSFIAAVELNAFNLAHRLTQLKEKAPNALPEFWANFGGKMPPLEKAIAKGLKHREHHAKKKGERQARRGKGKVNGAALGEPYTVAAIVAIALPIVTGVIKLFTKHKSDKPADAANDTNNLEALKKILIEKTPEEIAASDKKAAGSSLMDNKPLLIGGALALAVGGYFLLKKK